MEDRSIRRPRAGSGPVDQPLTLQETIERTLSNNPKTRQAWASVKVWAAAVGASKSAYLPNVSGDLEAMREDYATDVTGKPNLSFATRASVLSASISLSWLLYDIGSREAAVRNATALLATAKATQEATLQTAFLDAAKDYYAAQASQEALAVTKTLEQMANDSFVAALIRAAQDRHPSVLAARAQLTAALAKEQQVRAQGFPSASVISRYSFNNQPASLGPGLPEYPATGHDWYIGIQVSIPIFDGFARTYQLRQAHAQSELQR